MNKNPQTLLITGARAPIALEMARSFHRAGHRVIMADSLRFTLARWSNSVSAYYVIPSPRFENEAFAQKLRDIIRTERVDHLIPTCEETIFVAARRADFACKVWTADQNVTLSLHNKYKFAQLYSSVLPIPKTLLLSEFTDWEHSERYVFKPVYSRFASAALIRKNIGSSYFQEADKSRWIAQEFIQGTEICVYSIWEEGSLKAYAAYHPLYRAGKGAGIFFEPVEHEAVFTYVHTLGSHLKYSGQLCFDVIVDEADTPYFIECNPRGTSGAHFINRHLEEAFLSDTAFVCRSRKAFSIKYAMALFHPGALVKKHVWYAKDPVFDWNDLKPFFFQLISLCEIAYVKFTSRVTWLGATTVDIEWNGDET